MDHHYEIVLYLEYFSDVIIVDAYGVAMLSHDRAVKIVLRVIVGDSNRGGIGTPVCRKPSGVNFSTLGLELDKEGLVLLEDFPAVGLALELDLGIRLLRFPNKIVIGLAVVEGRIAGFLHDLG